jgi:hypothetical protein
LGTSAQKGWEPLIWRIFISDFHNVIKISIVDLESREFQTGANEVGISFENKSEDNNLRNSNNNNSNSNAANCSKEKATPLVVVGKNDRS